MFTLRKEEKNVSLVENVVCGCMKQCPMSANCPLCQVFISSCGLMSDVSEGEGKLDRAHGHVQQCE